MKVRPPRPPAAVAAAPRRSAVHIRADLVGGLLASSVQLDGVLLCEQKVRLGPDVLQVWDAMPSAAGPAGERLLNVGRQLADAILADAAMRAVATRVAQLPPGEWLDVVLDGDGDALRLPVELLRLSTDGTDLGPLGLAGGVSVRRCVTGATAAASAALPGPVKILAAVATPDETRTANTPLDVEAEMQAVLDAVSA